MNDNQYVETLDNLVRDVEIRVKEKKGDSVAVSYWNGYKQAVRDVQDIFIGRNK